MPGMHLRMIKCIPGSWASTISRNIMCPHLGNLPENRWWHPLTSVSFPPSCWLAGMLECGCNSWSSSSFLRKTMLKTMEQHKNKSHTVSLTIWWWPFQPWSASLTWERIIFRLLLFCFPCYYSLGES